MPSEGDLDIHDDPGHQEREWRFQLVGFALWGLTAAAALLGLLGGGPLSLAEAVSADGALHATFQRLDRSNADSEIQLRLHRPAVQDGVVRVAASGSFVSAAAWQSVQPPPRSVVSSAGRVVFEFPVSQSADMLLRFRFQPSGMGRHEYVFSAAPGAEVRCRTFVFP